MALGDLSGRHPLSSAVGIGARNNDGRKLWDTPIRNSSCCASFASSLADDARGFTAESAGASGVLILNNGHYRGVWHWMDGNYSFTPGGYGNSTHAAPTPQDAVSFTLDHVCRQ